MGFSLSMNRVILVGRVQPRNPEPVNNGNGTKFTVVTKESYKSNTGEWKEISEWHNIIAWGYSAQKSMKLLKGDLVLIEGSISTRKAVDRDGVEKIYKDIKAEKVITLTPRTSNGYSGNQGYGGNQGYSNDGYTAPVNNQQKTPTPGNADRPKPEQRPAAQPSKKDDDIKYDDPFSSDYNEWDNA